VALHWHGGSAAFLLCSKRVAEGSSTPSWRELKSLPLCASPAQPSGRAGAPIHGDDSSADDPSVPPRPHKRARLSERERRQEDAENRLIAKLDQVQKALEANAA
jgi:hypothetical protein